ncbi:MAG: PPOX class F420-dependent oxidoreductase [Streptosporangiaceae bacterium]
MAELNADAVALLKRPIHAWVTTLRTDGSLHNTVVWMDVDDRGVFFNTAVGRAKERNLRADPRISLSVLDPDDPFHLVSVSGTARFEESGADDVIDGLAKKYLGVEEYPMRNADEQRITVRIAPEKIVQMG